MQLADGPSMDRWLANWRPPQDEALAVFRGIVAGVGHAHCCDVVHRDLKPGNILLHVTPSGVVPKITDFGLAKALTDTELAMGTRTGMAMGTPPYMAPEQIRDSSRVDRRADLYALGVILYELMCGQLPHATDDVIEIWERINARAYDDPRTIDVDIPESVCKTIEALLSPEPADRPPDCAAVLEMLDGGPPSVSSSDGGLPAARPVALPGASGTLPPSSAGSDRAVELTTKHVAPEATSEETFAVSFTDSLAVDARTPIAPSEPPKSHGAAVWFVAGTLIVVVGAVGLMAFALIGWALWGGSIAPVEPAPIVMEPPRPTEPVEITAPPAPSPPVPVARPQCTRDDRTNAAPTPTPPEPAPTVAEPVATHAVRFTSRPMGATVWVDGQQVGKTPLMDAQLPRASAGFASRSATRRSSAPSRWDAATRLDTAGTCSSSPGPPVNDLPPLLASVAPAACPDRAEAVLALETTVFDGRVDQADGALAAAETSFQCGQVAQPAQLARLWQLEAMLHEMRGDVPARDLALRASHLADPSV